MAIIYISSPLPYSLLGDGSIFLSLLSHMRFIGLVWLSIQQYIDWCWRVATINWDIRKACDDIIKKEKKSLVVIVNWTFCMQIRQKKITNQAFPMKLNFLHKQVNNTPLTISAHASPLQQASVDWVYIFGWEVDRPGPACVRLDQVRKVRVSWSPALTFLPVVFPCDRVAEIYD